MSLDFWNTKFPEAGKKYTKSSQFVELYTVRCCCSVAKWCLILCKPMSCSRPGFPALHYLLEFAQTHVHWVDDAIQPSHPLLPPSPPALYPLRSLCIPRASKLSSSSKHDAAVKYSHLLTVISVNRHQLGSTHPLQFTGRQSPSCLFAPGVTETILTSS